MTPTIGRIVMYNTTEADQDFFRKNSCNVSAQLPAVVVAVWSDTCINVKVLVDGYQPDLWKTSILKVDKFNTAGRWDFPVIVK